MKPFNRALWMCAALTLGACGTPSTGTAAGPKMAPDFTLPTLEGPKISLASERGQVVLIDFWATWCEPCKDSIPVFERLHDKYKDKGVVVLGVNVDGSADDVPAFVKQLKMNYPVLLDLNYTVMQQYKVRGIPNLFLLDKQGHIRKHWIGVDDDLEKTVAAEVDKLLKES